MSLSTHTDAATAKAMSEMEACVQQVASYLDAQTSQAIAMLRQQLESEMVSVVVSTNEMAAKRTCMMPKNVFDVKLRPNYNKSRQLRINKLMRHAHGR